MLGLAITRWFPFFRPPAAFVACVLSFSLVSVRSENPAQPKRAPQVQLDLGVLSGMHYGLAGAAFLGIPYAAPPVGSQRWTPPQEPKPWSGIRDATYYRPACPQLPSSWLPEMLGRKEMQTSEDCLYLNVWTLRLRSDA